jgi:hypothetical protein
MLRAITHGMDRNTHHVYPQLLLMASRGHLRQIKNAQQVLQRVENHVPDFSLTAASVAQLFVQDEDHGRMLDGLKKASVLQD